MNDEQVEEIKRHFGVVSEGLGSRIQLVAEGVDRVNERLDSLETEVRRGFAEVQSMIKL